MDTDQTFVKGVLSPEMAPSANIPSLDGVISNGPGGVSLQCGQQSNTMSDSMDVTNHDVNTGVDGNDGETFTAFVYNDVIMDRLDQDVDGLPRDLYIQTLLKSTHGCEETLSIYRSKLAERAKHCENGPKGTLIARKNTNKRSVIEKYATDCHSLSQFLNGCMPDIDDIFKPASRRDTVNTGAAPNTPASVSRVEGVTMQSEISTIKNTIVSLLTDVNMLKSDMAKAKADILDISQSMKSGITHIENELSACKVNIDKHLFPKHTKDEDTACKSLSEGIAKVSLLVTSLDKHRQSIVNKMGEIDVNVRDNANGVEQLRDLFTAGNNTMRSHVSDLTRRQDETQTIIDSTQKKTCDAESAASRSSNGLNAVKRQIKDIESKLSENGVTKLEDCFQKLSSHISTKLNDMCTTIIEITKSSYTIGNNNVASSAPTDKHNNGPPPPIFHMPGLTRGSADANFVRTHPTNVTSDLWTGPSSHTLTLSNHRNTQPPVIVIDDNDAISTASTEHDRRQRSGREQPVCVTIECSDSNRDSANDATRRNTNISSATQCPTDVSHENGDGNAGRSREVSSGNSDVQAKFRGVSRHKLAKYYVGNIDLDATENDIHDFLIQNDVKCTQFTLFNSRNTDSLSAYIAIWEEHGHIVEDPHFWPDGVSCRQWITRPQHRRGKNQRNNVNGGYSQY